MQENIDSATSVVEAITTKLLSKQEKIIQHLLTAETSKISREFARQHDVVIREVVASVLDLGSLTERDTLLLQKKYASMCLV